MRSFVVIVILFLGSIAQAHFDLNDWDEKAWLVHASPIMMRNSTVVASALNYNSKELITSEDANIHYRMTHHHCLGALVPDEHMVFGGSIMGISFPSSLEGGLSKAPYVYMAL